MVKHLKSFYNLFLNFSYRAICKKKHKKTKRFTELLQLIYFQFENCNSRSTKTDKQAHRKGALKKQKLIWKKTPTLNAESVICISNMALLWLCSYIKSGGNGASQLHDHVAVQVWTLLRVCHSSFWTTSLSPSWMSWCQRKEQGEARPRLAMRWGWVASSRFLHPRKAKRSHVHQVSHNVRKAENQE